MGLPGPDAGEGGKFLLLPPGYAGEVPADYYVYRSGTYNVFVFLRAFYQDPENLTPAVALLEQAQIYPLNGQAPVKPMQFPNASGVPVNMLPISDGSAFDQLNRLVDSEGTNLVDPDWLGMLASIGIIKGQPFNPDAHTRAILDRAAKTAYKMSHVVGFEEAFNGNSLRMYADRHWVNPLDNSLPSSGCLAPCRSGLSPIRDCALLCFSTSEWTHNERATVTSNTYWDWFIDHAFLMVSAQQVVGQFLGAFKEHSPRQKAARYCKRSSKEPSASNAEHDEILT